MLARLPRYRLFVTCLLGICLSAGAACSMLTDPASDPVDESGGLLETDRAAYEVAFIAEEPARLIVDIPYTLTNTTSDSLYLIGCLHPSQPALQKHVEGAWKMVYSPIESLCLSPAWNVAPGATWRDTLRMVGFLPDQNAAPLFEADRVEGTYRLVRSVYRDSTGERLLPLSERISNAFALEAQ